VPADVPALDSVPGAALPIEQPSVADPVPLETDGPPVAVSNAPVMPAGPPALAVALLVAAALSNVAAGRSRR
jgi:hypothetical protein